MNSSFATNETESHDSEIPRISDERKNLKNRNFDNFLSGPFQSNLKNGEEHSLMEDSEGYSTEHSTEDILPSVDFHEKERRRRLRIQVNKKKLFFFSFFFFFFFHWFRSLFLRLNSLLFFFL